jgi:2-amino-4-hydroxy-6-hydroxymethyldihydropteridine diphosphokinase
MNDAMPKHQKRLYLYAIGLGSNRRHVHHGDPRRVLLAALAALESDEIEPVDASAIITSAPLGPSRRRFANAVAIVATQLAPLELLGRLGSIEQSFGIRTGQRWSARTLDLDILLWSEGSWSDDRLTIPHPEMTHRDFVLDPLSNIAGTWRHPLAKRTIRQLAAQLKRAMPVDQVQSAH